MKLLKTKTDYHLVIEQFAMEHPQNKWRYYAGKIIYFYGPLCTNIAVVDCGFLIFLRRPGYSGATAPLWDREDRMGATGRKRRKTMFF